MNVPANYRGVRLNYFVFMQNHVECVRAMNDKFFGSSETENKTKRHQLPFAFLPSNDFVSTAHNIDTQPTNTNKNALVKLVYGLCSMTCARHTAVPSNPNNKFIYWIQRLAKHSIIFPNVNGGTECVDHCVTCDEWLNENERKRVREFNRR